MEWQGSVSSPSNSIESAQNEDVLSPEDSAWVDSCLVKDPILTDSNWDTLKDALLDVMCSQPALYYDTSAAESDWFPNVTDSDLMPISEESGAVNDDLIPLNEDVETAQLPAGSKNDLVPLGEEAATAELQRDTYDELVPTSEKEETEQFLDYLRKSFLLNYPDLGENGGNQLDEDKEPAQLPEGMNYGLVRLGEEAEIAKLQRDTYDELVPISEKEETEPFQGYLRKGFLLNSPDPRENGDTDLEVDLALTNDIESSLDIFRVWDLDTPVEEDELMKQLEKALAESSLKSAPPPIINDSGTYSNGETLDDLIAGIGDLSLNKPFD